ncbi:gasdermin-A3-like [Pipra filicauda]|uniref:Gasdermin-A3-like n=1 Tax=Pipra filicauda TaxID=649802 RepID=A0A7R5KSI2_9PASS|nr:gasdermin-A3-like [Pipra filicauda]
MFKKVTRYIVNQGDTSKQSVPVESIADHEHFRPFCLLIQKRKQNSIFHSRPYYECTGFRLDSVLLPGEDGKSTESLLPSGDGPDSSQFALTKVTADQVDGSLSLSVDPASVELKGGGSLSQEFSIKVQKKAIPMDLLEALRKNRKINMDHSFIQQLQSTKLDLYMVSETLEASEETVYKESSKAQGGFLAMIYAKFSAKASTENIQSIVIPKGCTLAFRAIQMNISKGEWGLCFFKRSLRTYIYYFDDGKQSIFLLPLAQLLPGFGKAESPRIKQTTKTVVSVVTSLDSFWFSGVGLSGLPTSKLVTVDTEVKQYCGIFSELPSDLRVMFLNTITVVMRDRNLFQELSQKMEGVLEKTDDYELKTESPDLKDLLSTLENSPRDRRLQLAKGITYTLDALAELLDNQLALLLESLERKIVSQQLQLVGKLLEHNLKTVATPFHVDASLLSFPQQEDQTLTMALVEMSRVKLQEDGSAEPMEQPDEVVAALYVALYALSLLSGDLPLPRESLPEMLENLCPPATSLPQFHPS